MLSMRKKVIKLHRSTTKYVRDTSWQRLARACLILALLYALLIKNIFLTPDLILIFFLAIFASLSQTKEFLKRFLPIFSLLLIYEVFRGIADWLNGKVHYTEMINFDRWLGGGALPTAWLQQHLWHGTVQWYDFYFYFIYMLHFLAPLVFAVILWKFHSKQYWRYILALVLLSFGAFVTYLIYPAAPPWMAKELGYIVEPITRVSSSIWYAMGVENFSEVYHHLPANAVAAVPSLHSAYPLLISLFIIKIVGFKRGVWSLLYPISMWIGVVYMGEHYVIDVIIGALYAIVFFVLSQNDKLYNFLKYAIIYKLKAVKLWAK